MKRNRFIYLLITCIAASNYLAWADNSTTNNMQPNNQSTNPSVSQPSPNVVDTAQTNNSAANKNNQVKQVKKISLSKKIFSVGAALFIGTPVCIVRRTKYEEWYAVNGLIGDSNNKYKKVLAGIIWLPWAAICGAGEAPFDALANGMMYPAFSKDQLSQGKLIQNN